MANGPNRREVAVGVGVLSIPAAGAGVLVYLGLGQYLETIVVGIVFTIAAALCLYIIGGVVGTITIAVWEECIKGKGPKVKQGFTNLLIRMLRVVG